MYTHRLWPAIQTLGRSLTSNRVCAFNIQNFSNGYLGGQGHQQQNVFSNYDNLTWTQCINRSTRESFSEMVSRPLHTGNAVFIREYRNVGSEHAYAVLRSLPAYSATTVGREVPDTTSYQHSMYSSSVNWERCSAQEVADGFIALSQLCRHQRMDLEDPQYSSLSSELTKRVAELTDEQVMKVLSSLALWLPSAASKLSFIYLWNSLDRVCLDRMRKWTMSQKFLVADHWYASKLPRISIYLAKMTLLLGNNLFVMEPSQFVQYLFYANLSQLETFAKIKDIEKLLHKVLKHLSIEELGVIAMVCCQTQTFLKNEKLIEDIICKMIENLESVSDGSLCSILHLLRINAPGTTKKSFYNLLESLQPHLDRLNNTCLLQVLLLGTKLLVFHENVVNTTALRLSEDIKGLRLRDLENLTFALMLYNYTPPSCSDICAKIVEELQQPERIQEFNMYPKSFVSCVLYLLNMGFFAADLISATLQPSMVKLLSCKYFILFH